LWYNTPTVLPAGDKGGVPPHRCHRRIEILRKKISSKLLGRVGNIVGIGTYFKMASNFMTAVIVDCFGTAYFFTLGMPTRSKLIPVSIILLYIETRKSVDTFSLANACQT